MTILPRLFPGRNTAPGSGGNRPPGQGGNRPPGSVPSISLPTWTPTTASYRPPLPDPLPPAPLLDWRWAVGLAVGALLSEWGRINSPALQIGPTMPYTYNQAGRYKVTFARHTALSGKLCADGSSFSDSWSSSDSYGSDTYGDALTSLTVTTQTCNTSFRCIYGEGPLQYGLTLSGTVQSTGQGFTTQLEPAPEFTHGFIDGLRTIEIAVSGVSCNGQPLELPPGPELAPRPEIKPGVVTPSPVVPMPLPRPQRAPGGPAQTPGQQPGVSPVPFEPGPAVTPSIVPPLLPQLPTPTGSSWTATVNGATVAPTSAPVPVTRPDAVYPIPNGPPIIGNGPQTTPQGIAQELGRIEQKLHMLLSPLDEVPDWINLIRNLYDLLTSVTAGTTYTLTEYCNPGNDPNYEPTSWEFDAPGALFWNDVIVNRLDALAAMIDQSLRARQVTCPQVRTKGSGELVTVNFIANTKPSGSSAYLRKSMSYRDQTGAAEADHVAHWADFEWEAGPAIVTSTGAPWGVVQCWAVDEAEGQRVIGHAAAIAGIDLEDPSHVWQYATPGNTRYGKTGTMRVEHDQAGKPCISKRNGSSGRPSWALDP